MNFIIDPLLPDTELMARVGIIPSLEAAEEMLPGSHFVLNMQKFEIMGDATWAEFLVAMEREGLPIGEGTPDPAMHFLKIAKVVD